MRDIKTILYIAPLLLGLLCANSAQAANRLTDFSIIMSDSKPLATGNIRFSFTTAQEIGGDTTASDDDGKIIIHFQNDTFALGSLSTNDISLVSGFPTGVSMNSVALSASDGSTANNTISISFNQTTNSAAVNIPAGTALVVDIVNHKITNPAKVAAVGAADIYNISVETRTNDGASALDTGASQVGIVEGIAMSATVEAAPSAPSGGGGGIIPTSPRRSVINFSGYSYPLAKMTFFKNARVLLSGKADEKGNFSFSVSDIIPGRFTFFIQSQDIRGSFSALSFFDLTVEGGQVVNVKDIIISPTIVLNKSQAKKGELLEISGYAHPQAQAEIFLDGNVIARVSPDESGFYGYALNTQNLSLGRHAVRSRILLGERISPFNPNVSLNMVPVIMPPPKKEALLPPHIEEVPQPQIPPPVEIVPKISRMPLLEIERGMSVQDILQIVLFSLALIVTLILLWIIHLLHLHNHRRYKHI